MPDALPRLLYVSDVPVEASQHGSALMYRALEDYPRDRLVIVETGLASREDRRLPGVTYYAVPIAIQRWLNTRLHGLYSAWLSASAGQVATRIDVGGFEPEAVMTVGHGFGWITADALASTRGVPLHMVVHDDWPTISAIVEPCRGWLDRKFGAVYRAAASRLCVSPYMAEEYRQRYGVPGDVMYPSRSAGCPVFPPKPARVIAAGEPMVVGYGGGSGADMLAGLSEMAVALRPARARLEVFGPFDAGTRQMLVDLAGPDTITFHGLVPFDVMIRGLRDSADLLFVPMPFEPKFRQNAKLSFPSKLTDYSATGLPLLIYAPRYSSATAWALANPGVAAVVTERGSATIAHALETLRDQAGERDRLADRAVRVGHDNFDARVAGRVLGTALANGGPSATRPGSSR